MYLGYNYEKQQKEIAKIIMKKRLNSLDKNAAYGGIIGRLFKDYNLLDYAILAYEKAMEAIKMQIIIFKLLRFMEKKEISKNV